MDKPRLQDDDALLLLRQSLNTTDEALSSITALEQLQTRFEEIVIPHLSQADEWNAVQVGVEEAKKRLNDARGWLEEMMSQMARRQAPEMQARAWADQFVDLTSRAQAALLGANQQVTKLFETMRPTLLAHYLENATRIARWSETWPFDSDESERALSRIECGEEFGTVDGLDIQLARLRWAVGWPQQKMATVVGLSQPAVAARLARMENLINLSVATSHVKVQAQQDQFTITRSSVIPNQAMRGPVGDLSLESVNCFLELDLLVSTGEAGSGKRSSIAERNQIYNMNFARESSRRQPLGTTYVVRGTAIYFRDRGVIGYYTTNQVIEAARMIRSQSTEAIIQHLGMNIEPARTLSDLVQRAQQSNQSEE